jgi:hypothetical protein
MGVINSDSTVIQQEFNKNNTNTGVLFRMDYLLVVIFGKQEFV